MPKSVPASPRKLGCRTAGVLDDSARGGGVRGADAGGAGGEASGEGESDRLSESTALPIGGAGGPAVEGFLKNDDPSAGRRMSLSM